MYIKTSETLSFIKENMFNPESGAETKRMSIRNPR